MSNANRRLRHDYSAHIRTIQMSRNRFFGYCEGRNHDPHVYSEVIRRSQPRQPVGYTVYRIDEVAGFRGKEGVKRLYRRLRTAGLLRTDFKGKKYVCAFFMDKDVDEMSRRMLRSDHVFYTELYDIEAHLFRDGDLARAIAIALSIGIERVPIGYHDSARWIEEKAKSWQHWIELCVFSALFDISCGCGYGVKWSGVHDLETGLLNLPEYERYKGLLRQKSGLSRQGFEKKYLRVERMLLRLTKQERLSVVLKGKWLGNILTQELKRHFVGQPVRVSGTEERILASATTTLNYSSEWATDLGECVARFLNSVSG